MAHRAPDHPPLSSEALDVVASWFRVLGDPSRLRVLNTLMQGEHSVQQLVDATGMAQSNVSRHLGILRRANIVVRRAEGTRAVYSIADARIAQLCDIVCGSLAADFLARSRALNAGGRRRTSAPQRR